MSDLTPLDRIVLYWFWDPFHDDDDWPEPMGMLGVYVNPDGKDRHLRERETFVAGEALPTYDKALKSLQLLVDKGLVLAGDLTNVRNPEIDRWEIPIWLTRQGKKEAQAFDRMLRSEEGRRRTFEFARGYVAAHTEHLAFKPVLPTYLPRTTDPIPQVTTTDNSVALTYTQVVVEQATVELPKRHGVTPNAEHLFEDSIRRTVVSVAERHVTSVWAEIEITWKSPDTSHRLTFIEPGSPPTANSNLEYAVIDDSTRREARKIARSMIEQLKN